MLFSLTRSLTLTNGIAQKALENRCISSLRPSSSASSSSFFLFFLGANRKRDEPERLTMIGRDRSRRDGERRETLFSISRRRRRRLAERKETKEMSSYSLCAAKQGQYRCSPARGNSRADFVLVRVLPTAQRFSDDNADEQVALIERLPQAFSCFFPSSFCSSVCSNARGRRARDSRTHWTTYCAHIRHG